MTRLILDHFRRWWWVLLPTAALSFGLGWYICVLGGKSLAFWVLVLCLWMGATLLGFDLKHGLARTLLALPLTARQIGRGWWFASVGIPALAMGVLLCSGAALWSHFHPAKDVPALKLALACLFCLLWLGNTFTSIYGMTNELFGTWRERLGVGVISLLAMVMLFGSMLFFQQLFEKPLIFTFFLGTGVIVTVASWFRAERFVVGRSSFRLPVVPSKLACAEHCPPVGGGGVPFLLRTTFVRGFSYLLAMVGLMALLSLRPESGMSPNFRMVMVAHMGSLMCYFFIVLYHAVPGLRQLRLWRTLPISASRLAAVILALAILPLLAVGVVSAVVAGLAWGEGAAITTLKSYAFMLAPAALSMFLATWLGTGRGVYVLLFLIIIGWGTVKPMLETRLFFAQMPVGLSSLLVSGCVALCFFLTRFIVAHSSHGYRAPGVQTSPLGS